MLLKQAWRSRRGYLQVPGPGTSKGSPFKFYSDVPSCFIVTEQCSFLNSPGFWWLTGVCRVLKTIWKPISSEVLIGRLTMEIRYLNTCLCVYLLPIYSIVHLQQAPCSVVFDCSSPFFFWKTTTLFLRTPWNIKLDSKHKYQVTGNSPLSCHACSQNQYVLHLVELKVR